MRRIGRVLGLLVCGVAVLATAATRTLTNETRAPAVGIRIRFSESVLITRFDKGVFASQSPPSRRAESFTFSDGVLATGGKFEVSWDRDTAEIEETSWIVKVLFDENHRESRTISAEKAGKANLRHSFTDLAKLLSTKYLVVQGLEPLAGGPLADVGVVVLAAPREPFTNSECAALVNYVRTGGGLLLLADANPSRALDQLASQFGLGFLPSMVLSHSGDWDLPSYWVSDVFLGHPVTQAGRSFHTNWGTAISEPAPGVALMRSKADTWLDGDADEVQDPEEPVGPFVLAVALGFGAGRVVAIADNAFENHQIADSPGNLELFLGAIGWLVGEPAGAAAGS